MGSSAVVPRKRGHTSPRRVLIVEDDPQVGALLARAAADWGLGVLRAETLSKARDLLSAQPELILLDVHLPDGSAVELARLACQMRPAPTVNAVSGLATTEETFELARLGVHRYVTKPFALDHLHAAIESALEHPPPFEPQVARNVGVTPIREVQDRVRQVMLDQALALAGGNRSEAGRLLGVSRQAVQQMIEQRHQVRAQPSRPTESERR